MNLMGIYLIMSELDWSESSYLLQLLSGSGNPLHWCELFQELLNFGSLYFWKLNNCDRISVVEIQGMVMALLGWLFH